MTHVIRDGDIFHWRYTKAPGGDWNYAYWAKSQIAVAVDGMLHDTYWGINNGQDGSWFNSADIGTRIEIEFVANFDQLDKSVEGQEKYYDDADVVNLNHSNSTVGNFYIRKGAQRSRDKMLASATRKLESQESELRSLTHDLERTRETIAKIEASADLNEIYI